MNRIEAGKVFTAARTRTGTNSNGKNWELIVTQDERGNNDIAIFVANMPSNVKEGGNFRIDKILSVSYGNRKDNDGNWRANISVNAVVTAVESHGEFTSREKGQWEEIKDDGQLPF